MKKADPQFVVPEKREGASIRASLRPKKRINPRRLSKGRFATLVNALTMEGDKLVFADPRPNTPGAPDTCPCSGCDRRRLKLPDKRLPTESLVFYELKRRMRAGLL
jgi:hypothetical protein